MLQIDNYYSFAVLLHFLHFSFIILFFSFAVLILTCFWTSCVLSQHLSPASSELNTNSEVPDISMISDAHWLIVSCVVRNYRADLKVFISCPARDVELGHCYENCKTALPCVSGVYEENCVPDKSAVNCTESFDDNGSKVTTLRIDRRDPRMKGQWICSHLGLRSNVVNVSFPDSIIH